MDIRQIRKKLGMTQDQFGEAIGNVPGRTVRRWEAGVKPLPLYKNAILKLVEAHKDLILGD